MEDNYDKNVAAGDDLAWRELQNASLIMK